MSLSIKRPVGKLFRDHPWLAAAGALVCAAVNLYAYHLDSDTGPFFGFFDLGFALLGFLAFFGLLLMYLSERFYK